MGHRFSLLLEDLPSIETLACRYFGRQAHRAARHVSLTQILQENWIDHLHWRWFRVEHRKGRVSRNSFFEDCISVAPPGSEIDI